MIINVETKDSDLFVKFCDEHNISCEFNTEVPEIESCVYEVEYIYPFQLGFVFGQWIKEKILAEFGSESTTLVALNEIIEEFSSETTAKQDPNIDFVLAEIEKLKAKLQGNS